MDVDEFLKKNADGFLICWADQQEMMTRFSLKCAEAEEIIMQHNYLPARYQRNQQTISIVQQLHLLMSRVAVIGCGGLGGYILEELARLGVGQIVAVDPDLFEEHNLNRQLLSTLSRLGTPKVEAAVQRIAEINPAVRVEPIMAAFDRVNGGQMLTAVDIVIDAVDNVPTRLDLSEVCSQLDIPLIHGAIAGWYGQVISVEPGSDALRQIYDNWNGEPGIKDQIGNLPFSPAVIASIQVAEACKLLLGEGRPLFRTLLSINLLDMQFDEIPL